MWTLLEEVYASENIMWVLLIGFDQWVIHLGINQEGRKSLRACGRVSILDVVFPDGPPVEVGN